MSKNIRYETGNVTLLDDLVELWRELNQLHIEKSRYFGKRYESFTYEERKNDLLSRSDEGKILVIIAHDNNERIGYCVASISDGMGEIASIYVKEEYRQQHIGTDMMQRSLDWIRSQGDIKIGLKVAAGNEEVLGFYFKHGFRPYFTEMQIVAEE
jgi:ribosomal protein S18 acetylase RimI-like enzyme